MAINKEKFITRVLAGAVYVIVTGLAVLHSKNTTVLVVIATAIICCYEFCKMARQGGHKPYTIIACIFAGIIPLSFLLFQSVKDQLLCAFLLSFLGDIIVFARFYKRDQDSLEDAVFSIFAFSYSGLVLCSLIILRGLVPGWEGGLMTFLFLVSVWMTDAFAYIGGSLFGKHKFMPKISPKKTWEGVLFGFLASIIFWLLIPVFCPNCGFGFIWAVLCAIVCAVAGIVGDLLESHLKRGFGVKDSGTLIPGHGGLLDRSDSLISASVFAAALVLVAPLFFDLIGVVL